MSWKVWTEGSGIVNSRNFGAKAALLAVVVVALGVGLGISPTPTQAAEMSIEEAVQVAQSAVSRAQAAAGQARVVVAILGS